MYLLDYVSDFILEIYDYIILNYKIYSNRMLNPSLATNTIDNSNVHVHYKDFTFYFLYSLQMHLVASYRCHFNL